MIEGMQEGDLHVHVVDHRFRVLHRAANGHRWPVVVTVGPARQISQIQESEIERGRQQHAAETERRQLTPPVYFTTLSNKEKKKGMFEMVQ